MATFNTIGIDVPTTIDLRAATVTIDRGGTLTEQEIVVLGDPETSNAIARILNTTPASTEWALAVREVSESTGPFAISSVSGVVSVTPSAGSTFHVRAFQSTAADLNVTVAGYSTVAAISSVSGVVAVTPAVGSTFTVHIGPEHQSTAVANSNSSALLVRVVGHGSSAVDFPVRAVISSTSADNPVTATIGTNLQSSVLVGFTSSGLITRDTPMDSTFGAIIIGTGGDNTVISSVAGKSIYVYGIQLMPAGNSTTATTANSSAVVIRLQSGTTGVTAWRGTYYASSATVQPVSISVNPPQFLFKTAAAALLNANATSTGAALNVYAFLA